MHRASIDVAITNDVIQLFKGISEQSEDNIFSKIKKKPLKEIQTKNIEFDESSSIFKKRFVFTGKLERLTRNEVHQLVKDLGGDLDASVTKKTNYLVLGEQDYSKVKYNGKSSKQVKAENLKLSGYDIEIIPESRFYDMIDEIESI